MGLIPRISRSLGRIPSYQKNELTNLGFCGISDFFNSFWNGDKGISVKRNLLAPFTSMDSPKFRVCLSIDLLVSIASVT